jgi:hypothetical protein
MFTFLIIYFSLIVKLATCSSRVINPVSINDKASWKIFISEIVSRVLEKVVLIFSGTISVTFVPILVIADGLVNFRYCSAFFSIKSIYSASKIGFGQTKNCFTIISYLKMINSLILLFIKLF